MDTRKIGLVSFFLRLALAGVFLYAAIAAFLTPSDWVGYFPRFLRDAVPVNILSPAFSAYEIILSLWLFSKRYAFYAALVSALTLVAIIIANINQLDILFRDFAVLFAAVALAVLSYDKNN